LDEKAVFANPMIEELIYKTNMYRIYCYHERQT